MAVNAARIFGATEELELQTQPHSRGRSQRPGDPPASRCPAVQGGAIILLPPLPLRHGHGRWYASAGVACAYYTTRTRKRTAAPCWEVGTAAPIPSPNRSTTTPPPTHCFVDRVVGAGKTRRAVVPSVGRRASRGSRRTVPSVRGRREASRALPASAARAPAGTNVIKILKTAKHQTHPTTAHHFLSSIFYPSSAPPPLLPELLASLPAPARLLLPSSPWTASSTSTPPLPQHPSEVNSSSGAERERERERERARAGAVKGREGPGSEPSFALRAPVTAHQHPTPRSCRPAQICSCS